MAKGFDRLKSERKSFFGLYRDLVNYAVDWLKDPEFKLFVTTASSSYDFEGPNKGKIEVTVDQIKDRLNWSKGKASYTLNGLISKGFARRIKRGIYCIFLTLQEVQSAKALLDGEVQLTEHEVQNTEHFGQSIEHSRHEMQSSKDEKSHSGISKAEEDLGKEIEEVLSANFSEKI